jgi:hypothetical protein
MPNPVHGTIIITSRTPVGAGSEPAPTEPRPYGTRIYGTRIHGTRPYGTTICTQGRMCIFGEIVNGVMRLNKAGHIVAWTRQDLPNYVPNGIWDAFVVMPNPVHGIIIITSRTPVGAGSVGAGSEPAPTEPAPTEPASTNPHLRNPHPWDMPLRNYHLHAGPHVYLWGNREWCHAPE